MLSAVCETPTTAATGTMSFHYIGKDIAGQVGGLAVMHQMSKRADSDSIRFLKRSLWLQQTAVCLESTTPLLPVSCFIPIAGGANMLTCVAFTGIGATNAKVIQKLAVDDNVGEVYAKLTMLNTLASSVGMGMGLVVSAVLPDHGTRLCLLPVLGMLRCWAYTKAVDNLL